ncbi:MAG TPA: ComF family protein [Dehalococcoidia bacterium]|nr:ComF family protein [Dehalococcoidia bacterium]
MFQPGKRLGRLILELLFPSSCLGCGRGGSLLCVECQDSLPRIQPPLCRRCGLPLPQDTTCWGCREWRDLDGLRSVFRFEGLVRQAIHKLKYENLKALARPLAELLASYMSDNPMPAELMMAVPLHPRRLRERGYNQSALVTRELGRLLPLPVAEGVLVRRRHTSPQAKADSAEMRRRNVAQAFECREGLRGQRVLLVDDVCTTGATLESCAAALKAGGAPSVWALTIAREL